MQGTVSRPVRLLALRRAIGLRADDLKALLNCLVAPSARNPDGLGLIEDDSPKFMPEAPRVFQLPAKRGAGYSVVRIFCIE